MEACRFDGPLYHIICKLAPTLRESIESDISIT